MLLKDGCSGKRKNLHFALGMGVVCIAVLVAHWPSLSAGALCFDDNQYIAENILVRTPSLRSAGRFLGEVLSPSSVNGYYQPLSMISLMVDSAMGGGPENLHAFHRTNLSLHVLNTVLIGVLLYLLFDRSWAACLAALLFGLHPMVVEPVVWVSERKTLLAASFSLGSLIAYVRYVRANKWHSYVVCALLYVLALMSKPTSTSLPLGMLLLDFWPLRRLSRRSMAEKIPLFIIGGVSAVITYVSQKNTCNVILPGHYGLLRIPLVFAYDIGFYFAKMVWPANLTPHYAFPIPLNIGNPAILKYVVLGIALVAVLAFSLRWTRSPMTGWLIFFVMILPTMQALQFSDVIASDKFAYLPASGILIVIAWAISKMLGSEEPPRLSLRNTVVISFVIMLGIAETLATRHQLTYWKDSETLFAHMAAVTPESVSPHNNLALIYAEKKEYDKAAEELRKVLSLNPNEPAANFHMGRVLQEQGNVEEALSYFRKVMTISPEDPHVYNAIGELFVSRNMLDDAIETYRAGLKPNPGDGYLHRGLGMALLEQGRVAEAIQELTAAAELLPDAGVHVNLGHALLAAGDVEGAVQHFRRAIWLDPGNPQAHYNLGNVWLMQGRLDEAVICYEKAIALKPDYAKAYGNMAAAFLQMGDIDLAISGFRSAVAAAEDDVDARYNLASALASKGLTDDAIVELRTALKLDPNDVEARCTLADLLARQDKRQEALAEYREAQRIAPDSERVKAGLAELQKSNAETGQPNDANSR